MDARSRRESLGEVMAALSALSRSTDSTGGFRGRPPEPAGHVRLCRWNWRRGTAMGTGCERACR